MTPAQMDGSSPLNSSPLVPRSAAAQIERRIKNAAQTDVEANKKIFRPRNYGGQYKAGRAKTYATGKRPLAGLRRVGI